MFEKKLRTFIMILTILLSTMVLFVGLSLNDILNDTYTTMTKGTYGDGNVLVSKETDEDNPLFAEDDVKTDFTGINERLDMIQAVGQRKHDDQESKVTLTGLDTDQAFQMNVIHPIDVPKDFQLQKHEAMISARTATNEDLTIGDEVTVEVQNQAYTYSIGAISETNGLFYAETDDMLLVVTKNQVRDIYGAGDVVSQVLLAVDDDKVEPVTEKVRNENEQYSVQETGQLDTGKRDEETFQTAVVLAIVIIVMISGYVIFSLSKVIVQERMPVVATFRSIGASKRIVNRILRMEFLFYGVIGAVLGMVLALFLLPVAADSFNEYKAHGVETVVTYHPVYVLFAFFFGAIFPVIGSMFHIYRMGKHPLKEMILQTPHTIQERSTISVLIGFVFFVSSIGFHIFNQQENLLFAIGAVVSLFIAVVLLMPTLLNGLSFVARAVFQHVRHGEIRLGIKNVANNKIVSNNTSMIIVVFLLLLMIGNTSAGIDQYIKQTVEQDFDVMMEEHDMDFTTYEDLDTVEGIADAYMQPISQAAYHMHGEEDTFIVYGVEDLEKFDRFYAGATFLDGAKANLNHVENGVIIDEYQAKRYNLEVGDKVTLDPLDADEESLHEEKVEVELAGTMEAASLTTNRDIMLVPLPYYEEHFVDTFNQIVVKAEEASEAEAVKENIEHRYDHSGLTVQTFAALIGSQKETVDTLIHGVLLIILLGLVIGLLGISNNLLISFHERKNEYAVLYSVCMSRKQIIKMLVYEMAMTYFAVLIIGIVAGLGMNIVWNRLLSAVGLRIQFSFNYELYFLLSGAVLVLLALATWVIVRKVTSLNVLQELRYE